MCVGAKYLGCHYKYFTYRVHKRFSFFSHSHYICSFLPSSNGQLWHEQTTFPSSITKSLDKDSGKCHVLTLWCYVSWRTTPHGQVEGHHFWFSRKQVRCYLQSTDTLELALWRTCFNKRKIKFLLQPSTGWINWERFRYDPNFPDAYDRCLVLQVTHWVCEFAFFFNQSVVRVRTWTWQTVWSIIWVNGCVRSKLLCTCFKPFKTQQTASKMPALQHPWQKDLSKALKGSFYSRCTSVPCLKWWISGLITAIKTNIYIYWVVSS